MSAGETITVRRMQPLLGTWVEIRATGRGARVERAVRCAFLRIARVQQRMSFHAPDSVLTRINQHAYREPQAVDPLTWDLLRKALALSRASMGTFDITVGAALVARGVLPDHGFSRLDAPSGSDAVALLPGRRVALRRPVLLTLDGIAKGYAVDLAIDALARAGVQQAVVNAGGDLRVFGPQALPLGIRCADGTIRDIAFSGEGCAISTASASLLTEAVKGRRIDEALALFAQLHSALVDDQPLDPGSAGKLLALQGVKQFPARVKCALLAWHTLRNALTQQTAEVASTEKEH